MRRTITILLIVLSFGMNVDANQQKKKLHKRISRSTARQHKRHIPSEAKVFGSSSVLMSLNQIAPPNRRPFTSASLSFYGVIPTPPSSRVVLPDITKKAIDNADQYQEEMSYFLDRLIGSYKRLERLERREDLMLLEKALRQYRADEQLMVVAVRVADQEFMAAVDTTAFSEMTSEQLLLFTEWLDAMKIQLTAQSQKLKSIDEMLIERVEKKIKEAKESNRKA